MRILLDTHSFVWAFLEPARLNLRARALFDEMREPLYLSAASSWEIAIKSGLEKLALPEPAPSFVPSRMAAAGIRALAVEHVHALRVAELPAHHADPFDRLLIAQAQLERMTILSADPLFALYDVETIWAGVDEPPKPRRRRR